MHDLKIKGPSGPAHRENPPGAPSFERFLLEGWDRKPLNPPQSPLFTARLFSWRGGRGAVRGHGLRNIAIEVAFNVGNPRIGRALLAGGHDEHRWSLNDSGAAAQCGVGLDRGRQLALRVDIGGQANAATLGKLLREKAQLVERFDGGLIGENLITVILTEFWALCIEPPGIDRCQWAPDVPGNQKVVTNPRDLVLGHCLHDRGIGATARRALEVGKLNNRDAGPGRRTKSRSVVSR